MRLELSDGTVLFLYNGYIQGRISSGYILAMIQHEIEKKVKQKCIEIMKEYSTEGRSLHVINSIYYIYVFIIKLLLNMD